MNLLLGEQILCLKIDSKNGRIASPESSHSLKDYILIRTALARDSNNEGSDGEWRKIILGLL